MTINQINIILATAKYGSISSASKALGLSQPNVSNGIKTVEEEIGFTIFQRSSSGISITDKGTQFLEHAMNIAAETQMIMEISQQEPLLRLRVGHTNSMGAFEAFKQFCAENIKAENTDLRINSEDIASGIQHLDAREIDILVSITLKDDRAAINQYCDDYNLEQIHIAQQKSAFNVREGHPLFATGLLGDPKTGYQIDTKSESFPLLKEQLMHYSMVIYENMLSRRIPLRTYRDNGFPCCSCIYVENTISRHRLVAATNAFSLSRQQSEETQKQYHIVSIPVKGYMADIHCLVRKGELMRPEISRYISILKSLI